MRCPDIKKYEYLQTNLMRGIVEQLILLTS
jgi:hypothetical protein